MYKSLYIYKVNMYSFPLLSSPVNKLSPGKLYALCPLPDKTSF